MSEIIVSKFGGSSITKSEDISRIEKIVKENSDRKIIVVSAPGKRNAEDVKVTDLLIDLAKTKDEKIYNQIIERFSDLYSQGNILSLEKLLRERMSAQLPVGAYEANLKAFGEEACAKLVAEATGFTFVDAKDLFNLTNDFGNAKILDSSKKLILKKLNGQDTFIIPGFYGRTRKGKIATFSRGGSDLSGAYIASALDAFVYENFTDKKGILTSNLPNIDGVKVIRELTFKEIRDLSYSGFGIFHSSAMIPLLETRTPVHVRSAFDYPSEGTYIVCDRKSDSKKPIVGIAYTEDICSMNISWMGMNDQQGIIRRAGKVFEEQGISIEYIPSGIDDLSVIFKWDKELSNGRNSVGELTRQLSREFGSGIEINFQNNLGVIVIAGKDIKKSKGLNAKILTALDKNGVDPRFISYGAERECIIYGIDSENGRLAVETIHKEYLK